MTKKSKHAQKGKYPRRLFNVYYKMKCRCYRPMAQNFKHYGGRGISVCDDWLNSGASFYEWAMENGWKPGLQLDRIDPNGNYLPSNCRFVTKTENVRNRREQLSITVGTVLRKNGKWRAHIRVNGVLKHLGYFQTRDEAIEARKRGEMIYWGKPDTRAATHKNMA